MSNQYFRINYSALNSGDISAEEVSYDNANSGLTATNAQEAIDELQSNIEAEALSRIVADTDLQEQIGDEIARAQAAEALLIPLSQKGVNNGVATLDGSGKVPAAQLPSYVDDVLEFPNFASFPVTGETGKIYIAQDTNFQYRWSGSAYFQLSVSPVSSVFGRTGVVVSNSGDYTALQITNTPAGGISATTVQAAINELDSEKFNTTDFNTSFDTQLATKSTSNLVEGTNLYFTDERAQDAVGSILTDTTSIDFTYDDVANTISAAVLPAGVNHNSLQNYVANEHINHTNVQIATATNSGLSGGGDITATRNLAVDITGTTSLGANPDGADEFLIWDTSASARRKVTYQQIVNGSGSTGDIRETSVSILTNQSLPVNLSGFSFSNSTVRSFQAIVSVFIDATSDLFEEFFIEGVQRGSDWVISYQSVGDDSGVNFDITSSGQVQYTSLNYAGFVSGTVKFRAITTSI